MRWVMLGAAVLLAVAAASVWYAFQQPGFVSGLTVIAAGALWEAVRPTLTKPASPEKLRAIKRCQDTGGRYNHRTGKCE